MAKKEYYYTTHHPKTLIIGVQAPYNKTSAIESYFDEFVNLVKSNKITYDAEVFIKLRDIDSTYFFTQGKLIELQTLCDQEAIKEVIISEPLTAQQERNLEDLLHCRIIDRTQLILEIFERNAHSAEGKAQVAVALLKHKKSRLAGKGIHLSQQSGKIGNRGPGETAKEREARHLEITMQRIRRELTSLHKIRETQRKTRITNQVPQICLIGYTNAGKSTIMNTLTKSNVLAENKLFATLDTTTRALFIHGKKIGILSDTVGFIQHLPHNLIEAFKSTLSELNYADLLLHVVDISDPNWQSHIEVVHTILQELNVEKDMLYVFNKADKASVQGDDLELLVKDYHPQVLINATTAQGIKSLQDFLQQWHQQKFGTEQHHN